MDRKKKYFKRRGKRGVIYLNERHCGVQLWDCLHTTDERIAEIRRRELHIAIERGDYHKHKIRVSEVLQKTVDQMGVGLSVSSKKCYGSFVRNHLEPWFGGSRLADLKSDDLVQYKRSREKSGASEPTIKQEICLFRGAMKRNGVDLAPVTEAYVKPHKIIERFLTEAELYQILECVPVGYRPVMLVAAYSGLRKMDVVHLRWSHINLRSGFISVKTTKRKKVVKIPIHPKLSAALSMVPRGVGDARVFDVSVRKVERAWVSARELAGFPWARFHDLRHFFGCFLATHGERREVIAELMGITMQTAARYARFDDATLEEAVQAFCRQTVSRVKKHV